MGVTKGLSVGVASCCSVVHATCIWGQPPMHVAYVGPKASNDICNSVAFISLAVGHSLQCNYVQSPFLDPRHGLEGCRR